MPTNRRRTSLASRIGGRLSKCEALEDRRMLSVAHGDFNGDGYDDLAIGVPNEEVNGFAEAGAVNVIYGSPNELDPIGNQLWTQDSPSIFEEAEAGDHFGAALATGDFNNDGYDDLAIGVPGEDVTDFYATSHPDAGVVNIIYGSALGLTFSNNVFIRQETKLGQEDFVGDYEYFGHALAAADYNGDGYDDVAIGAPGDTVGGIVAAGSVGVVFSSSAGLSPGASFQYFHEDTPGVVGVAETGDQFGFSLAAGDFNGDGAYDLAVGTPYEDVGAVKDAGAITVVHGSGAGINYFGSQNFHQGTPSVYGVLAQSDLFGYSLASGDMTGDGFDDVAIGVPGENVVRNDSTVAWDGGAVNVLYSYGGAVGVNNNVIVHQNRFTGGLDYVESGDRFGTSVAVADFNGDGLADLAVGAPFDDEGGAVDAGVAEIIYSAGNLGLADAGAQLFSQGLANVLGTAEVGDNFGAAVAAGDFNGDGYADLVVGIPKEDISGKVDAGAIEAFFGQPSGVLYIGEQWLWQGKMGILGDLEDGDGFGSSII